MDDENENGGFTSPYAKSRTHSSSKSSSSTKLVDLGPSGLGDPFSPPDWPESTNPVDLRRLRGGSWPGHVRSRCSPRRSSTSPGISIVRTYYVALCLLLLVISALPVRRCDAENTVKEPLSLVAIGTRYGTNAGSDRNGAVDRVDVFGSWRTPYAWEFTPGWDIGARLNASVGVIRSQGELENSNCSPSPDYPGSSVDPIQHDIQQVVLKGHVGRQVHVALAHEH